jgi:Mago nashi protein
MMETNRDREDDEKWPKRNKDGRQELEIRLGNEHIAFDVSLPPPSVLDPICFYFLGRFVVNVDF